MTLSHLSDDDLLDQLRALIQQGRDWEVEVLVHLAEVERRDLHLARGFGSLYEYCTEALGFDKYPALDRIAVARLGRRVPRVLEMVSSGELTLTAARTLGPHLNSHSSDRLSHPPPELLEKALLEKAAGKTVHQIRVLLAALNPKPDVPVTIRKTPARRGTPEPSESASPGPLFDSPKVMARRRDRTPKPEPLAKDTYKMTFTASAELVGMLEEVKTLMSHNGGALDEAAVVETAVRELRDRLRKKKYALGAQPSQRRNKVKKDKDTPRGRRIPNAVKRAVAERDGLRCAYRDAETGRRCKETRWLEFQHHEAYSRGGAHSVENLSLYCRGHNQFAGRRDGLIAPKPSPLRAVDTGVADGEVDGLMDGPRESIAARVLVSGAAHQPDHNPLDTRSSRSGIHEPLG